MQAFLLLQTASQEVRRNMGAYKEVRSNMSEGLRFYMSLQEAIAVLAQQAGDYILTRRLQRWDTPSIALAKHLLGLLYQTPHPAVLHRIISAVPCWGKQESECWRMEFERILEIEAGRNCRAYGCRSYNHHGMPAA